MAFPKPIPREMTSRRRASPKKPMKPMGKVVAQKKSDDNRKSAQQLAQQVSNFLRSRQVSNIASIDHAIRNVQTLVHRMQIFKVQQLNSIAASASSRSKARKRSH